MGTALEGVRAEPRPGLAHDAETFCEAFQRTARQYSEQTAVRAHGGGPELDLGAVLGSRPSARGRPERDRHR